ncbi:MAG: ubiquinol-cytochrome c reductase iron-sulfur subunit, partial [Fimbriimonadales bacterium]
GGRGHDPLGVRDALRALFDRGAAPPHFESAKGLAHSQNRTMDEKLNQDFPIDWEEDHYVTRREFFKFMTLASGGLAVGSAALAAWASVPRGEIRFERTPVASTKDIAVGGSLQFSYPRASDLCILLQPEPGKFVAYSRRCTHLSCPVEYQPDQDRLYCPCHNGAFAINDGHVLQGPPPRPLPQILLEISEGRIFALGVKA